MYTRRVLFSALLVAGLLTAQDKPPTVQITGAVKQPLTLSAEDLAGYVLAEAQDGYQVLFSLAELDPAFVDNQIQFADTANGKLEVVQLRK